MEEQVVLDPETQRPLLLVVPIHYTVVTKLEHLMALLGITDDLNVKVMLSCLVNQYWFGKNKACAKLGPRTYKQFCQSVKDSNLNLPLLITEDVYEAVVHSFKVFLTNRRENNG